MKTQKEKLIAAMDAASIRPYRHESGYSDSDAQSNLMGRTHYVDPDTLKYFKARILNARKTDDGLLYWLVESIPAKGRRAVVFDVFGTVLTDRETWHSNTGKAEEFAREFCAGFDAVKHTAQTLRENTKREIETSKRVLSALK